MLTLTSILLRLVTLRQEKKHRNGAFFCYIRLCSDTGFARFKISKANIISANADESKVETFDASLLIGTWKRTATEAEGDTNDGGDCTITITGSGKDDLKISYYDKAFPDTKFSEKPITIVDSNTDSEIPEGSWRAVVDYVGAHDTKYDFEISEDGTLVFCNSFEIDGAPMVSIEIFEKTE